MLLYLFLSIIQDLLPEIAIYLRITTTSSIKIFVIKKNISNDVVVVGQEGFYYIRKGEEYYYPWPEIKNITWGTIPKKHKVRRGVINITFWNDSYFRFLPGKYDQSEFAVNITITTGMKILKMYEKLFRKYWKPDFTFKESYPRI